MWRESVTKKVDRRVMIVRVMALVLVMLVLMLAAYLYGLSRSPAGISEEDRESVTLFVEALRAVQENYVDQEAVDPEEQTYGAIEGMIDSLGDEGHTRFLTPEEAEKSREAVSSTYVGIGVRLEEKDDEIVVKTAMDGSPAEKTGIQSGDVLVAVDGESVTGEDFEEIGQKIRGTEGTYVDLTVLRDEEEREFIVERAELEVPVSSWSMIPGTDVAHLRLSSFSENSAEKLEETIAEAQSAGAERFVLDLRDNPGGLVEQAEEVSGLFLPAESGVYIRKDADGSEEETSVPEDNDPLDAPLVVLVNEGSSSSAEIVAGALRDNDRAEVVGETTFGTGTVLSEYPLSDGSAILLGVAEWLTPNGDSIRGSGIEPDVEVELEEGQEPNTPNETEGLTREEIFEEDAQLERAFGILRQE
ncbi:MAG TPA: S41 family peptidase [Rubrobacteraceae bacterium]|jgi:carboxyl-terminal processing protease